MRGDVHTREDVIPDVRLMYTRGVESERSRVFTASGVDISYYKAQRVHAHAHATCTWIERREGHTRHSLHVARREVWHVRTSLRHEIPSG